MSVHGNPWLPSPRGVALVMRIELARRRPSVKGWVFYGIIFAVITGLGILVAVLADGSKTSAPMELVLVMVLGAGMLIAPSLSATSINGDSSEGVLAPLQMTRLTAGDLAVGKLLASWVVAFAVLVTTTPFLIYAFTRSGWTVGELALVLAVILLVVLTSTAIGLAWSSIAARAVASVSLAHLTTGFLLLGTLLLFALTMPLVSEEVPQTQRMFDWEKMTDEQAAAIDEAYMNGDFSDIDLASIPCHEEQFFSTINHTDRTAWLLLINPVVVIGEVSPLVSPDTWEEDGRAAPGLFAQMHAGVSAARMGSDPATDLPAYDECSDPMGMNSGDAWEEEQETQALYAPAPWLGLGVQVFLLVGSLWIVIARLRVPYKTLRTGTRVA